MSAASNRATVNGYIIRHIPRAYFIHLPKRPHIFDQNTPPPQTAAQALQEQQLRQTRIQSFLSDNSGPNYMLSHASTSVDNSMARHRAEAARKIDDVMANLNG
ncbi:hypothetical protein CFIO01_04552 [Colletotrichum fioriniae PJ7]|uniref:Uncharacterized protein n=1 Tax=Colletotrichum fioriniae PJ7 TaxID=1445577 RepID=A0A010QT10_9PEZI|nr:hypothetical protein CFIO01_04552 [Colletotrichum fioriniae PJ7]